MSDRVVGVIGAGVMGVGLAQDLAQTDHDVILVDRSQDILDRALDGVRQNVRGMSLLGKLAGRPDAATTLERIRTTTDYQAFEAVEFIIENVTEDWSIKRDVYAKIDAICRPECVFAANTSAFSITRIGSVTQRPDRVIGMHFMNPVPLKRTVEVIRGHHTSQHAIERATGLLRSMGKEHVLVQDSPGFVSNRVLMLTINEAIWLLQDQVASARDVDHIFKSCFGHPMGPLETADLIGLDTILLSILVLHDSFHDSKYRPCPLLQKMVDAGLHGRKSGKGFYDYAV